MSQSTIISLINNVALLMALALIYDAFTENIYEKKRITSQVILGAILGSIGIAIMLNPWEYLPGIFFDTRSVLLCITGYFFGLVPTVLTILMTSAFRLTTGGTGAWTGVMVIITSGVTGLIFQYFQKREFDDISTKDLLILGTVTHVFLLLWMLTLPYPTSLDILSKIFLPVLLIFPPATALLGKFIINRFQRIGSIGALRQSEAKYKHLFDSMTQGVIIQDAEGKIIEANTAASKILGLSKDQMFGKTAYDPRWKLVREDGSPYDPSEMPSNIVLRTGKPTAGVQCGVYVPEEDTYRWLVIGSAPRYRTGEKKPSTTMTVFSDITALKLAESKQIETERRYRRLFENMTAGFVLFEIVQDEAGTPIDLIIITANEGFERTTGLKIDDAVGQRLTKVLPGIEKDEADWIGKYGMVALTGKAVQMEQGSELLGYFYSIMAYQAAPKQCAVTFIDITDRKLAELRLNKSEYRFRRTVEHLPHVIVIYDKDLKIQYINAATLQVSGRPQSDFIGKTDEEIWPPEICNKWMPMLRNTLETGHTSSLETTLNLEEEVYLRITIIAIKDELGKVLEVVGITEDLTENKRQEREIRDFTVYLQSQIEKERIAISREIHDDLGPTMTALKFDIGWLKRRLSKDQDPLIDKMGTMLQTIDSSMQTIKKVCTELRPGILDDMGIGAALEWYITRFEERTGISCQLVVNPKDMVVEQDMSTALFRIHQEALTNINRHAEATQVNIELLRSSKSIDLTIEDNGKGIRDNSLDTDPTFGIIGMRERVAEFGGEFSIENLKEGGVLVKAKLPVKSNDASVEEVYK